MKNPISYDDLFDSNLETGLDGLLRKVQEVENQLVATLEKVKKEAKEAGNALLAGGDINALASKIDALSQAYDKNTTALENVRNAKKKRQEESKNEESANKAEEDSIKALREEIKKLKTELEAMSEADREGSAEAKVMKDRVKELDGIVKNYEKSLKSTTTATTTATTATKQDNTATMTLAQAYDTLNDLLEQTGVDVNQLGLSQKAVNSALKNGEIAANSATGSYNQLYAQYNLLKIVLNAMERGENANTEALKALEAQALDYMNALKAMQANTGNYTLSVGNYEKALNGLNISTQQVLREMPTLANSFSLFIIAISNNVPIFIDNFKRAADELGGFKKAVSATLTSILSWQTALLVLLTILPGLIRKLKEKKKAQEEDNDVMREAITLAGLMNKALIAIAQEEVRAASETITLTKIIGDETRSMDEQVEAARRLKDMHEETLSMYSAEEIAAGKAQAAIDNLTESIKEQAKARAIINKITEYSAKLVELELSNTDKIAELGSKSVEKIVKNNSLTLVKGVSTIEDFYSNVKKQIEKGNVTIEQLEQGVMGVLPRKLWDMYKEYAQLVDPIDDAQKAIDKLVKMLDPSALAKDAEDTSKVIKDETLDIPEYYFDMLEAIYNTMEEGLNKELALYDLAYEKEKNSRQNALDELNKMLLTANEDERAIISTQKDYLLNIISEEEKAYVAGRERLINEHITTIEAIEEEGANEEEKIRNSINIRLKAALETRNSLIYENYEKGNILKAELDRELRESERQYWSDYLKELRENGVITIDIYNDIMAKLAKEEDKNARKNARRSRLRNIVEVGFALSDKTGETDPDTGKRKVRDEYIRFADAVNAGLEKSMDYMDEWMDKRIEMADVAIEQAKREAEIAKEQLDYEQQARANGYANNVEMARKEYEEQLALQRKAEKEKEKLQKAQELIDTAQQLSSLVTAVAEIWSAYGGIPVAGPIIAAAVTATMFGAFAAAKIQAAKVAKTKTYGEGMVEYLDYGGSHASGNDIDFGVDKKGRRRRVERGEMIGVINKRNVDKYGVSTISGIFNSLNKGTYRSDVVDSVNTAMLSDMYGMSFIHDGVTDLSILEQGVQKLVAQNETKVVSIPNGRIEYKGNSKRIIYTA